MAVPAHDERDLAFAETFGLGVRRVVAPLGKDKGKKKADGEGKDDGEVKEAFTGRGVSINSGEASVSRKICQRRLLCRVMF